MGETPIPPRATLEGKEKGGGDLQCGGDPQTPRATLEGSDKSKDKGRSKNKGEDKERSSGGMGVSPTTRKYLPIGREILDAMDEHIKTNIANSDYTPAKGFDDFCKNHAILLATEILSLKEKGETDKNYISSKIKKTYKNRYYIKGHAAL